MGVQDTVSLLKERAENNQKFDASEVTPELAEVASHWLAEYKGDFDFLLDLRAKAVRFDLSTGQLKGVLNCLLADIRRNQPKAAAPVRKLITEDGMYRTPEGEIFKVQFAKNGSGRLYAKALLQSEDGSWYFEYARGAIGRLTAEMKMTLEQAKAFGALYGTCCVCGRTLTDENSIEAGIGPVCAGKGGW